MHVHLRWEGSSRFHCWRRCTCHQGCLRSRTSVGRTPESCGPSHQSHDHHSYTGLSGSSLLQTGCAVCVCVCVCPVTILHVCKDHNYTSGMTKRVHTCIILCIRILSSNVCITNFFVHHIHVHGHMLCLHDNLHGLRRCTCTCTCMYAAAEGRQYITLSPHTH